MARSPLTRLASWAANPPNRSSAPSAPSSGGINTYTFDTSPQGASTYTLRIYNGPIRFTKVMATTRARPLIVKSSIACSRWMPVHMGYYMDDANAIPPSGGPGSPRHLPTSSTSSFPAVRRFVGDRILVHSGESRIVPDLSSPTRSSKPPAKSTELKIHAESLSDAHTTATALGGATSPPISNRLTVANLAPAGQDGVSLDLGRVESFDLNFDPMDPAGFDADGADLGVAHHRLFQRVANLPLDELT